MADRDDGGRRDPADLPADLPARAGVQLTVPPDLEDDETVEDLDTFEGSAEETAESDEDDAQDGEPLPSKLYFRIGEVAQYVGVDSHVLRYWESEFKMKPHRSSSGQRLYRKQDLARFLRIRRLLHDEGYTIAGARKILSGQLAHTPTVDPGRLQEVLDQLNGLRDKIRRVRDEFGPRSRLDSLRRSE